MTIDHLKLMAAPRLAVEVASAPELNTAVCAATFMVSTPAVDNDGDILVPKGSLPHLERLRANPVVLWCHDVELPPIATAADPATGDLSWHVMDDGVRSTAWFHGKSQESTQVWALIEAGVLRGASVGYDEVDGKMERLPWKKGKRHGVKFHEWKPREWSVCPLPVNPETLLDAIHKPWDGKALAPSIVKSIKSRLPHDPKSTFTFAGLRQWVSAKLPWSGAVLLEDVQGKGMAEDETTVAEETKTLPPGAQALQGFTEDLAGVLDRLNEALPQVENPDVLAVFEEVGGKVGEQMTTLQDATKRIYPDLEGTAMADEIKPEIATEKAITEDVKPVEPEAKVDDEGVEHLATMQDTGDLLNEMAKSDLIPKSYRLACGHQRGRLEKAYAHYGKGKAMTTIEHEKAVMAEVAETEAEVVVEPEVSEEDVAAIKALADELSGVRQQLRQVTGKAA